MKSSRLISKTFFSAVNKAQLLPRKGHSSRESRINDSPADSIGDLSKGHGRGNFKTGHSHPMVTFIEHLVFTGP